MKIKQPDCRVIVFNLDEREGSNLKESMPVATGIPIGYKEQDISSNVISIRTNKLKSSPSGTFSIQLDPSKNWVSLLSVGSWISIFFDEKQISQRSLIQWNEESLKWIGRIDTVRASRQVDQATGAWITTYTVSGRDWASALEAMIYIDTAAGAAPTILSGAPGNAGFGQNTRFVFDDKVRQMYSKGIVSSSDIAEMLLDIWGKQGSAFNITSSLNNQLAERFMPFAPFYLPTNVALYMGKTPSFKLSSIIERKYGKLVGDGRYENNIEAAGAFDYRVILGVNSIWQVLNSTTTVGGINEILADLDFSDGSPNMCVFKRIRPFSLKPQNLTSSFLPSIVSSGGGSDNKSEITSSFFLLPKTYIDPNNILYVDVGGNWSDVINFIEIMPNLSLFPLLKVPQAIFKGNNAIYSVPSYTVSGFKPIRMEVSMFPVKSDGTPDIEGIKDWLDVLQEWYFDTHKRLNGTIAFSGQSGYIAVGSNIIFPTSSIADGSFVSTSGIPSFSSSNDPHILAHVENVSHSIDKSSNGAVTYTTTVQFVRGVIVDNEGVNKISKGNSGFGVDSKTPSDPRINKNVTVTK
jgi:hypothetical protein